MASPDLFADSPSFSSVFLEVVVSLESSSFLVAEFESVFDTLSFSSVLDSSGNSSLTSELSLFSSVLISDLVLSLDFSSFLVSSDVVFVSDSTFAFVAVSTSSLVESSSLKLLPLS